METPVKEGLPLDPTKGLLLAARKLRFTISLHVDRGGSASVGTVLKYVLARIYLLEGVKLSQRPLQDLRAIYTADHAQACGISYRNLALVMSCLEAMHAEREALPFGHEPRLADMAATMQRDATRRYEASVSGGGAQVRAVRLKNANDARHVMGLPQRGRSKKLPTS